MAWLVALMTLLIGMVLYPTIHAWHPEGFRASLMVTGPICVVLLLIGVVSHGITAGFRGAITYSAAVALPIPPGMLLMSIALGHI